MHRTFLSRGLTRRHFSLGTAAALTAGIAPFNIGRANPAMLKIGVLLPRSGVQAAIGQDCQRAVEIAPGVLQSLGLPPVQIISADTESDPQIARAQAEKLISEGVQLLIGAFDSGQTTTIAQTAEQRGIPLVINIAAAPQITEQGYKFVFRNFPVASSIIREAFVNQKLLFDISGVTPKEVAYLHVNDTLGMAMSRGVNIVHEALGMPYKIVRTIGYDPKARDLSIEVASAKGSGADALLVTSRLNDAILITRELIRQRWSPSIILSVGPGWYEDQYIKTLERFADGPVNFNPSYDPHKPVAKLLLAALAKTYPDVHPGTNHVYTFEALLVAADAFKRAGSADPQALIEAIRATNITDNVGIGPGISFNEKGQNDTIKGAATQIQAGRHVTITPASIANGKPVLPMVPYDKRS